MKNLAFIAAALCSVLFLENCSEIVTDPEPSPNTYTWKGTLYKAYGNEVWPNAAITLTASERQLSGYTYKTIASGYTDENGYFEIQYDEFDPTPDDGEDLLLEANGLSIKYAPYNVNVDRDFCGNDHCEVLLKIHLQEPLLEGDSLFVSLQPINYPNNIVNAGAHRYAILGPLNDEEVVQFKTAVSSCYNYCGSKIGLGWGLKDTDENKEFFNLTGFPFVDTIDLHF